MKKITCIILSLILGLLSVPVSASNIVDVRVSRFNDLVRLSVIPEEYSDIDLDSKIKRSEAIEVFLTVATEMTAVTEDTLKMYNDQDTLSWRYVDVSDGTKECTLAVYATLLTLMQGECTANPNERLARMDDFLTWEECLCFSMRILSKETGSRYDRIDEAIERYKNKHTDEEPLLSMARDCGLINQESIAYESAIWISEEDLNQSVTWKEFVEIIHRMLYIPVMTYGYGGIFDYYRIDTFWSIYSSKEKQGK